MNELISQNLMVIVAVTFLGMWILDGYADGGMARVKRKLQVAGYSGGAMAALLVAQAKGLIG